MIKILCKNCFKCKEEATGRVFNGMNIFSVGYLYVNEKNCDTVLRPHFSLSLICCSCNTKGESKTLLIRSPCFARQLRWWSCFWSPIMKRNKLFYRMTKGKCYFPQIVPRANADCGYYILYEIPTVIPKLVEYRWSGYTP